MEYTLYFDYPLPDRYSQGTEQESDSHVGNTDSSAGESTDGGPIPLVGVLVWGDIFPFRRDVPCPIQKVLSRNPIMIKPHETKQIHEVCYLQQQQTKNNNTQQIT